MCARATEPGTEIQRAVPDARIVKAFNAVFAQILGAAGAETAGGRKVQVLYAGDPLITSTRHAPRSSR